MKYGPVNIYYASQTGTAEGFAETIREEAADHSIYCNVISVKDFDEEVLKKEKTSIFVIATHYEGEPPDDAVEWWDWMEDHKGQQIFENEHKYVIYGLGDLTYKYFCRMGKQTDEILQSFGSERLYELGTGSNDQNNIEEHFEEWKINLWNSLTGNVPKNPDYDPNAAPVNSGGKVMKYTVEVLEEGEETNPNDLDASNFDLNTGKFINARDGKLLSIKELRQKSNDFESTLELEIVYPFDTPYETAGNMNVFPENSDENVQKALDCVGLSGKEILKVGSAAGNKRGKLPCPEQVTAHNLFKKFVDLQGYLKKSVLKKLLNHVKDSDIKEQLQEITKSKEKMAEMTKKHMGIIDIITNFNIKLSIAEFLDISTRIVPRLFTIASSPKVNPKLVRIVATVDCTEINEVKKVGLTSLYFKDLQKRFNKENLSVRISYQSSTFYMPEEPNTPCILIATGAGYAPFRGFTEEKEYNMDNEIEGNIGKCYLFFGCRNSDGDFLYKDRIQAMTTKRVYTNTYEAFSRDIPGQKVYVQHLLKPRRNLIGDLLFKENGNIYVCGNLGMSKAVAEELKSYFTEYKECTDEEANAIYEKLLLAHKINVEAWG